MIPVVSIQIYYLEEFHFLALYHYIETELTIWNMVKNGKVALCLINQALSHEGVRGSGCIDPHFLDLGTSWRLVVSFTLRPLYPEIFPSEPIWTMWRRENSWLYRDSNSDSSVVDPVASRYNDCSIPALNLKYSIEEKCKVKSQKVMKAYVKYSNEN
jgi:hypothetical protein